MERMKEKKENGRIRFDDSFDLIFSNFFNYAGVY